MENPNQVTVNSRILPCSCDHAYQDRIYGIGKRVHSRMKQSDKSSNMYRCTVCTKEKSKS